MSGPEDQIAAQIAAARAASDADDLEKAREAWKRVTELDPARVSAWINYGASCGELDRLDEAKQALEQALAIDPDSLEATSNLGVVCRDAGELEKAEALFRKAVSLSSDFVFGHYNLGHTLFLAGRFSEGAAAYRAGLKRDPEKTGSQNARLAWCLIASGEMKDARRELARALERIPREETAVFLDESNTVLAAIEAARPDPSGFQAIRKTIAEWAKRARLPS